MLKAALVISSFIFCACALFASPPSAEDAAEWRGIVTRSANGLWRTAGSGVLSAIPSLGDVAHYARSAGLRAESVAEASLRNFCEPEAPAPPEPQRPVATSEGGARELDALLKRRHDHEARAWISQEDIECPPDAELPRPWCDPRVQAVLRLLEEDRDQRGAGAPLCGVGLPAPPPPCE